MGNERLILPEQIGALSDVCEPRFHDLQSAQRPLPYVGASPLIVCHGNHKWGTTMTTNYVMHRGTANVTLTESRLRRAARRGTVRHGVLA